MRKVGVSKGSLVPSPIPGSTSETGAGEAMKRTGSGGAGTGMAGIVHVCQEQAYEVQGRAYRQLYQREKTRQFSGMMEAYPIRRRAQCV